MLRAALLATVFLAAPAIAAQPNIIVIMTDDQDDASLAGMPKVSARLSQGTRFTNSIVDYAHCAPSRATFFTGQRRANHGVLGNIDPPVNGWGSFFNKGTLPMWLQDAGYVTGFVGVKVLNQYDGDTAAFGFDHYAVVEGREDGDTRYYDPTINLNGTVTVRTGKYSTDEFRKEAVDFIQANSRPYFLMVAPAAPHVPALPAARHEGLGAGLQVPRVPSFNELDVSDKPSFIAELPPLTANDEDKLDEIYRRRYESLLAVDDLAEAMIAKAGPNTCVFYTSDHGFLLGDHRIEKGKLYAYEASLRVPLVMWGCNAPEGAEVSGLVGNVDLPATILDLAEAESGRRADGRSLLTLLTGGPWRTAMPVSGAWDKDGHAGDGDSDCVRTTQWSYCSHSTGERELYSLDRDPYQLTNKASAPDRADVVAALHALAMDLKDCAGNGCWVTRDPLKKRNKKRR